MIGDHGTVQVFLWSSARVGGVPITTLLKKRGENLKDLRERIEKEVRYANITIIEGHNASQYGIGIGINDLCSTGRIHRHGDTLPMLAKLNVEQFRALGPLLALFGRIVVAL